MTTVRGLALTLSLCAALTGVAPAHAQVIHAPHAHPPRPAKAARVRAEKAVRKAAHPVVVRKVHPVVVVWHPEVVRKGGETRPHLRAALEALQAADKLMHESSNGTAALSHLGVARHELDVSAPNDAYHGRRNDAIVCTKHAIKALEQTPPSTEAMGLTSTAIGHVQACLSAP